MIYLRPHHINCLFFYIGKGYNKSFTNNMTNIYNILHSERQTQIKFILNCDDLCKMCPNKINQICKTEKHIHEIDTLTIEEYSLDLNKIYTFQEIIVNIYRVYNKKAFLKTCSSCEWYKLGICSTKKIDSIIENYK